MTWALQPPEWWPMVLLLPVALLLARLGDLPARRQARVAAMEGGTQGPGSFGTSFLRREFVVLVLDALHALRGELCWATAEIKSEHAGEVVAAVLRASLSSPHAGPPPVVRAPSVTVFSSTSFLSASSVSRRSPFSSRGRSRPLLVRASC